MANRRTDERTMADEEDDPYAVSDDDDDAPKGPPPKIEIEGRELSDITQLVSRGMV